MQEATWKQEVNLETCEGEDFSLCTLHFTLAAQLADVSNARHQIPEHWISGAESKRRTLKRGRGSRSVGVCRSGVQHQKMIKPSDLGGTHSVSRRLAQSLRKKKMGGNICQKAASAKKCTARHFTPSHLSERLQWALLTCREREKIIKEQLCSLVGWEEVGGGGS